MAVVYSTRFYIGVLPATEALVYTAPAGHTVVLKDITIFNNSADPALTLVSVHGPGAAANVYTNTSLPAAGVAEWQGHQVLNAGDTLTAVGTSGGVQCLISGYLLEDA